MSVNWGDALLLAMRNQLVTVSSLPAARQWLNTGGAPPNVTVPFAEDGIVTLDSEPAECGPNAMWRTTGTYRVSVRVPAGTDAQLASSIGADILDSFETATITVIGQPWYLENGRMGPAIMEPQWLHMPVYLSFTFDHA